ncbi:MAG: glucans biosynthesis glucosyltransferase MdoH, partial [Ideonella sp.]|nr:glucans biosynthesis glucosyltransferase MdoH [Ideonella sp.]
ADFCRRWGRRYHYMVVLDADSVMSGDALTSLVRLMEAHPNAGIIQTAPVSCGVSTLHARAQQFAGRVVGRLFTAGMQYWQLGESHYWGHNAILRTAPFMRHCGLAPLPGTGGLSGHILSHDFVEAALMRRAGHEVWLVGDLDGSYEQQPPNLVEELVRDRRWCQGNLQNARLITEPGLRPVHRAMLVTGAMAYLSAPLWLGFVLMGAALWLSGSYSLFPAQIGWPIELLGLWSLTLTMLILPRLLGVVAVCLRGEAAWHGGPLALAGGALLEATLSMLQAPVRMLGHTVFVLVALTGLKLEWKSPPREAQAIGWTDAWRRFGLVGVAVGLGLGTSLWIDPAAAAWLLPVGGPLLVAAPLAVWTSRPALGRQMQRWRLLLTPEELVAPGVLRRAWALAATASPAPVRDVLTGPTKHSGSSSPQAGSAAL